MLYLRAFEGYVGVVFDMSRRLEDSESDMRTLVASDKNAEGRVDDIEEFMDGVRDSKGCQQRLEV